MDIKVISTIILSLGPIVSAVLIALFNNIHLTRIHQSEMDQNQQLKKIRNLTASRIYSVKNLLF